MTDKEVVLTKEDKKNLPPEIVKALEDGSAVVIPVPQPLLSGMWLAVMAGLTVTATLAPLFIPVTTGMAVANGLMGFGWFAAFAVMDRMARNYRMKARVASGVANGVMSMVESAMEKHEVQEVDSTEDSDGTSKAE